jgi:hypothetical protein
MKNLTKTQKEAVAILGFIISAVIVGASAGALTLMAALPVLCK